MRVIQDNAARQLASASVVTVGNFDGMHLGHQALIQRCLAGAEPGQVTAVVTFEPLPQVFFRPEQAPARLSSPAQKLELIEESGIDLVWLMRFNQALAEMPAADFARSVLAEGLGARRVVVGSDFRFGRSRQGDVGLLTELGKGLGFAVEAVADVEVDGRRVSSTLVRELLASGDLETAARCLGRPFSMRGRVIAGQQLGRKLGYPTANLRLEAAPSPLSGVFAVRARVDGQGAWRPAVASLGVRPAVGGSEFLVEVHIFDFDEDLYNRELEVRFIARIRDEQDFPGMEELVEQMKDDEQRVREILNV
jgi:riboflavin kinase/FMN adenylyltransferase